MKNIAPLFNIKAEKIIIAGDSAGGNLAAGIIIIFYKYIKLSSLNYTLHIK